MKLIRCYIENFGGLQQYTVEFNDGLTIIHEPNGFGKTTLAEFIRAMFYGFPRANKDITRNPRLKYLPWQGGRYGGYLIFEQEGRQYRIDRSFGEVPKGDKFKLTYEDTKRESKDFSADIGSELFGLDGDSFLRSTYMPQMRDNAPLTTDNIRAKLGNLLEDTGDVGSYEKALQRLKDKRTVYEHYRGNGGSIHEAQRQITALQQEIALCTDKQPLLEDAAARLHETRQAQILNDAALQHLRKQLSEATTAEAEAALSREYEALCSARQEAAQALETLTARYPKGVPSSEELEEASKRMDDHAMLEASLKETPADRSAAQTVSDNKTRFANGTPTAEDFAAQRTTLDGLMTAKTQLQGCTLTAAEAEQLTQLEQQLAGGIPTDEMLQQCKTQIAELTGLQHSRSALELTSEDAARLQRLEAFFQKGIPSKEDIHEQEQLLTRAEEVRRENLQLSAAASVTEPAEAVPQKKFHSLFFPCLIFGILAAAAGICLLTMPHLIAGTVLYENHTLLGGICAALALAAIITAAMMQNHHSLMSKLQSQVTVGGMTAAQRSLIHENERAASVMESLVSAFLESYPTDPNGTLRSRLSELSTKHALYLPLRERSEALGRQAAENDARTAELTEALHKALSPYFDTIVSFDTALQTLVRRIEQYEALSHKHREITVKQAALSDEIANLEEDLSTFLLQYGVTAQAADFRPPLDTLRRDADSYTAAAEHIRQRAEALADRDARCEICRSRHNSFCTDYGLTIAITDRQALKAVERDAEAINRLTHEAAQAHEALQRFLSDHGPKPPSAAMQSGYDLDGLKSEERELIRTQNALHADILRLEQRCRQLRSDLDRIPDLTDELNRLTEQKAADTEKRRLLDSTADFLQKARESLSASYLSGVQGHFARYLSRLTHEDTKHISVNTDLEVQLERAGSARALPHFSAGQTDAVHLCMRLALSDALFENGGCFMILDDPFVNLDDHHTAQALELLQELAADRQIVYLVCNSSRL